MKITITAGDDVLKRFGNQIGALGNGAATKAVARAVNRTTNTVHGRVIKAVARQSNIPTALVRRDIGKRMATPNLLEGIVWSRGEPLSLKYFRPRQFAAGTKARFSGKWHMFPGAFMGPRPGVIAPRLEGHVFIRTSKKRTPIVRVTGPSVPEELVRAESAKVFEQTVATMLPKRVAHELGRLLPR